jgi:hypothetical protein
MGVGQRTRHLLDHAAGGGGPKRAGAPDSLSQGLALDVGHDEEHELAHFVHREDRHDARVREPRRRSRLVEEQLARVGLQRAVGGQELDGDAPIEAQLASEIDDPHAAAPQAPLQLVAPRKCLLEIRK